MLDKVNTDYPKYQNFFPIILQQLKDYLRRQENAV